MHVNDVRGSFGFSQTMAKKENNFIVAAHDLKTLAATRQNAALRSNYINRREIRSRELEK